MRTPIIAGNWKMNKNVAEAVELVRALRESTADVEKVEMVVCPPFVALTAVKEALAGSKIGLGAQNVYWEEKGAFTGEISPLMLKDLVTYVIIGHSERRQYFGETDATVNKRVKAALAHGLTPIMCVGETLAQREAGETSAVVTAQVMNGLAGIDRRGSEIDRDCVRTGVGHRHRARFDRRGCQCGHGAEHPRAVEQVVWREGGAGHSRAVRRQCHSGQYRRVHGRARNRRRAGGRRVVEGRRLHHRSSPARRGLK